MRTTEPRGRPNRGRFPIAILINASVSWPARGGLGSSGNSKTLCLKSPQPLKPGYDIAYNGDSTELRLLYCLRSRPTPRLQHAQS
eukprot:3613497-Lingulodinium_polyedra.AAC.1